MNIVVTWKHFITIVMKKILSLLPYWHLCPYWLRRKHPPEFNNQGLAKFKAKDYAGALQDFNKSIELDAKNERPCITADWWNTPWRIMRAPSKITARPSNWTQTIPMPKQRPGPGVQPVEPLRRSDPGLYKKRSRPIRAYFAAYKNRAVAYSSKIMRQR